MAAGLGFKNFTSGEVLTAADVNGYLMQGILVFADATARDAAITSPQEGQFAFLKDTNVTTYYTGSAWANVDTTGMTNPMTTTGDTIYSSSGSTPARLGIGTTGQVLTVAGGVPSWATPAGGGGKLLQVVTGTTSTQAINSTSTFADTGLTATITPTAATSRILVFVHHTNNYKSNANANNGLYIRLLRDATELVLTPSDLGYNGQSQDLYFSTSLSFDDSPSSTSALTYKTQFRNSGNHADVRVQRDSRASSIVLMEIGA
jgi:hypothetical protein